MSGDEMEKDTEAPAPPDARTASDEDKSTASDPAPPVDKEEQAPIATQQNEPPNGGYGELRSP